jgi:DNA-binding SARP family transcriptional activator
MNQEGLMELNQLSLTLFGSFQIDVNGRPVDGFASKKVRALLVYLAVEADRPHRRDRLAEMFWPDKPEGVARRSLKQALSNLRKSVGDREAIAPFLLVDRDEIQFNAGSDYHIDVAQFTTLIKASAAHSHQSLHTCQPCVGRLRQAVELYSGDFLEQFSLPDSAEFEEWVILNREALQRQMSDVLASLVKHSELNEDSRRACEYAYQLATLEPWNEENHRELMRLLALGGQRSAALMQYQNVCRILASELGVEPAQETTRLFEQIRDGDYEKVPWQPVERRAETEIPKKTPLFRLPLLAQSLIVIIVLALALSIGFLRPGANTAVVSGTQIPDQSELLSDVDRQTTSQPSFGESPIPQTEYQALVTIYNETGGSDWRESHGWLSGSSPCNWFGVTCNGGSVSELHLPDNNLRGVIPAAISLLTNLKLLNLEFNQLSGPIPSELGGLSHLEFLVLAGNSRLSGPVPPELGKLTHLYVLALSSYEGGTQLSGPIPPELGNLRGLTDLVLANSLVTGSIPPELGGLTNLGYLDLSNNPLIGTLPPELGNLVNLRTFSIGEGKNELRGPLPVSLMNLKKLQTFQYHETELCEPADEAFQEWLNGIDKLLPTAVSC